MWNADKRDVVVQIEEGFGIEKLETAGVVSSKRVTIDLAAAMRIFTFILANWKMGFASLVSFEQSI